MKNKQQKWFKTVTEQGVYKKGRYLVLCFIEGTDKTRAAFIISKKKCKSAVRRNRIRRLLREALRQVSSNLKQGLDIIVFVKPQMILLTKKQAVPRSPTALKFYEKQGLFATIKDEMEKLFKT
ncbi:ribonuclease P protein component [bacterium Unc6]|nr:ribonuclease P protein component [bacterium Unc6]